MMDRTRHTNLGIVPYFNFRKASPIRPKRTTPPGHEACFSPDDLLDQAHVLANLWPSFPKQASLAEPIHRRNAVFQSHRRSGEDWKMERQPRCRSLEHYTENEENLRDHVNQFYKLSCPQAVAADEIANAFAELQAQRHFR